MDHSPIPLDGMDVWNTISHGEPSPRKEILLNIDLKNTTNEDESSLTFVEGIAFRMGDMKLLINVPNVTWYKPPELGGEPVKEQDATKNKVSVNMASILQLIPSYAVLVYSVHIGLPCYGQLTPVKTR